MKADEIKLLFDYNEWADRRILTTAAAVSPEQYVALTNFGIGFQSLRGTLVHTLDSEVSWRLTCQGYFANPLSPSEYAATELKESQFPTVESLQRRWQDEEKQTRAYIGGLSDSDVNGSVRYTIPGGLVRERVLWHCLLHVLNHGTQHRSEAAALLTAYGRSPGEIDFTVFMNERLHLPAA